jgi:hypothetical protein
MTLYIKSINKSNKDDRKNDLRLFQQTDDIGCFLKNYVSSCRQKIFFSATSGQDTGTQRARIMARLDNQRVISNHSRSTWVGIQT